MPIPIQVNTPPVQPAVPQFVVPSLESLQGQAAVLQQQLNALIAQRIGLTTQIRLSRGGGDQIAMRAQMAELQAQIAKTTGDLANVRAQIELKQGKPFTYTGDVPSNVMRRPGLDPDLVAGLMFAFIFAVMMPISIAYARRIWRGKPKDAAPRAVADPSSDRMERLEQAVDSIAIEIERISEGQRFVTKVLAERMPAAKPAEQRDATSGLPEGAPFLALGAGPMEPIRVPERQAMRASITPH